jgi:hypothetical protein
MGKKEGSAYGENFNTLAQSGTDNYSNPSDPTGRIVSGLGSDMGDRNAWKRRAKRKMITQKMILSLIEVAEKKGEPERKKAYWNTYHCQEQLFSSEGRVFSKYCKNRFCTICCSIRKAEIINRYLPVLQTWEDPYFVTLTVKAVPAENLGKWLEGIHKAFRQIREKFKKKSQRGTGVKFIGIKSLECNFNPVSKTYNPHLHIIVPNRDLAVTLIIEWQKKWTKKYTSAWAQYKRKVENLEKDLIEVIKYGSKIFTEPDMDKSAKSKIPRMVYAAALDNIFCALAKYRLFERFGFNLPKQPITKHEPGYLQRYDEWAFEPSLHDWFNEETGELMTGFVPSTQLKFLLSQNINTDLA